MKTENKKLIKQGSWYTIGLICCLACNWLIIMLLPKFTDFEKTGFYSLAYSTSQLFYIISVFSLRDYQVISNYDTISERTFFSFRLYTCILSFVTCIFYSLLLGYNGSLFLIIVLFLISNTIVAIAEVMLGTLQIKERLEINGYSGIIVTFCKLFFFFSSLRVTQNFYIAVFFGEIIPSIIYFFVIYFFYIKIAKIKAPYNICWSKDFICIAKNTLPLLAINFITIFITTYPRIIIEKKESPVILGYYSILISIANIIPSITTTLFTPLLSLYASLYKNKEIKKLAVMHIKVFALCFCMCLLIIAASFFILPPLFRWYYGNDLLEYINVFHIGMIGVCFLSMAQVARPVLLSANKNNLMLLILFVSAIPLLILTPVLVSKYSALGAALALLVSYLLFFVFSTLATFMIFSIARRKTKI